MLWRTELRHCKFYLMLGDYLNLLVISLENLARYFLLKSLDAFGYTFLQHAVIYQTLTKSIFVKSLVLGILFYQDNFI